MGRQVRKQAGLPCLQRLGGRLALGDLEGLLLGPVEVGCLCLLQPDKVLADLG